MTLAIMCIPIFDTLRVMVMRVLHGYSPFQSDKTHLHHLFIEMGFSHLGAALCILFTNSIIVLTWFLLWKMGAGINIQTYAVILMGMTSTFGFYLFMKGQQNGGERDERGNYQGTPVWRYFCIIGSKSHYEKTKLWKAVRRLTDWNTK